MAGEAIGAFPFPAGAVGKPLGATLENKSIIPAKAFIFFGFLRLSNFRTEFLLSEIIIYILDYIRSLEDFSQGRLGYLEIFALEKMGILRNKSTCN